MSVATARELFIDELKDIYSAETLAVREEDDEEEDEDEDDDMDEDEEDEDEEEEEEEETTNTKSGLFSDERPSIDHT